MKKSYQLHPNVAKSSSLQQTILEKYNFIPNIKKSLKNWEQNTKISTEKSSLWSNQIGLVEQRGDTCCPICMVPFTKFNETILSCSHIFHSKCIQSFEKFVDLGKRQCPLCRHLNYQKKDTTIGSETCQKLSAIKIQAVIRSYLQRIRFYAKLKTILENSVTRDKYVQLKKVYSRYEFTRCYRKIHYDIAQSNIRTHELLRYVRYIYIVFIIDSQKRVKILIT
jgi:hypothetical protein